MEKNRIILYLQTTNRYLLLTLIALIPLAFASIFTDQFEFIKQVIITGFTLTIFIIWFAETLIENGKLTLPKSQLNLVFLTYILAIISVTFFAKEYFLGLGDLKTLTLLLTPLFFFSYKRFIDNDKDVTIVLGLILIVNLLVNLPVLLSYIVTNYPLPTTPLLNFFMANPTWNPAGSAFNQNFIQIISILVAIPILFSKRGISASNNFVARYIKPMASITLLVSLLGLALINPLMTPSSYTRPSLSDSWQIALNELQTRPLFGRGPGNFIESFMNFKPVSFNSSDVWQINFGFSHNAMLQLATEMGLIGLMAFCILLTIILMTIAKGKPSKQNLSILLGLIASIFGMVLLPFSVVIYFYLFLFIALLKEEPIPNNRQINLHPGFILIFVVVLIGGLVWLGRIALGDYYYSKSIKQTGSQVHLGNTYRLQQQAINYNPLKAEYHIAYSQTNLILANSVVGFTKTENGEFNLTPENQTQVRDLITQAGREAKRATIISPKSALTWQNSGLIFGSLINLSPGSREWTLTSYLNAVNFGPTDPKIRNDFAQFYLQVDAKDQAISQLIESIKLKPDYPNTYYNLGWALYNSGRKDEAIRSLEQATQFLPEGSEVHTQVLNDIEKMKANDSSALPTLFQGQVIEGFNPQPEATSPAQ